MNAVIIVYPVGNITVLLCLQKLDASLNGMDCAWIDLDEVSFMDRHLPDQLLPPFLPDHFLQLFPGTGIVSHHQMSILLTV